MAWNDGISRELSEFFSSLSDIDETTRGAFESVIDEESSKFQNKVYRAVPRRTGGLQASFKVERKTDRKGWYGYSAEFEGTAPNGEPYQKIANILNYGKPADEHSGAIAGEHFITNAIRGLKGMDARIEARIEAELAKRT